MGPFRDLFNSFYFPYSNIYRFPVLFFSEISTILNYTIFCCLNTISIRKLFFVYYFTDPYSTYILLVKGYKVFVVEYFVLKLCKKCVIGVCHLSWILDKIFLYIHWIYFCWRSDKTLCLFLYTLLTRYTE